MCGIAGSFPVCDKYAVRQMLKVLRHRGPDDCGLIGKESICLGHRRLSIIDLAGGHQPLLDEGCNAGIVFNGEIYNFRNLRAGLSNHTFKTRTDTEVILRMYKQIGQRCVNVLDGMFAFAIMDGKDLFLARDPLGIKPLYYTTSGDGVMYFASEIKALFQLGFDVHEFPPGTVYHSQTGFRRFFRLAPGNDSARRALSPIHDLRQTLSEAVQKRMIADVPVGVCCITPTCSGWTE